MEIQDKMLKFIKTRRKKTFFQNILYICTCDFAMPYLIFINIKYSGTNHIIKKAFTSALFETYRNLASYLIEILNKATVSIFGMCLYTSPFVIKGIINVLINFRGYIHIGVDSVVVFSFQWACKSLDR